MGFKTTYGYPGSKDNEPKKNSLFVNRLINKGAIIIGKTNTNSTDWKNTTQQLIKLQEDWKKAGYSPKQKTDKIWKIL